MPETNSYLSDPRLQALVAEQEESDRKRAAKLAEQAANKEFYERPEMQGPGGAAFKYLAGGERPTDPRKETSGQRGMRVAGVVGRAMDPIGGAVGLGATAAGASPETAEGLSMAAGLLVPDATDVLRMGGKAGLKAAAAPASRELTELAQSLTAKPGRMNLPDLPKHSYADKAMAEELGPVAGEMVEHAQRQYDFLGGEAGRTLRKTQPEVTAKVEPGKVSGEAFYSPSKEQVVFGGDTLSEQLIKDPKTARVTAKHETGHAASKGLRVEAPQTSEALEEEFEQIKSVKLRKNIDKFEEITQELYGRPGDAQNILNMARVRAMDAANRGSMTEEAIFSKLGDDIEALTKNRPEGASLKKTLDAWTARARKMATRGFEDTEGLLEKEATAKGEQMVNPSGRVLQQAHEMGRATPYRAPGSPAATPRSIQVPHGADEPIADVFATSIEDPRYYNQLLEGLAAKSTSRPTIEKYLRDISSPQDEDLLADLANEMNIRLK